jgi:hypothetical protein
MLLGAGTGAPLPLPDAAAWPLPASAPSAAADTREGTGGAASLTRSGSDRLVPA